MGVLANLVLDSSPAYYGDGLIWGGVEGTTWRRKFRIKVNDVALDLSGVTGVCHIIDNVGGSVIVAPTCAGDSSGILTVEADKNATVGLAGGSDVRPCRWWATLADGTDVVQLWAASNSAFRIFPKGA